MNPCTKYFLYMSLRKGQVIIVHFSADNVSIGCKTNVLTVRHKKDVLLVDVEEVET